MSLLRLLRTGKSWTDTGPVNRYKVTQERLLPKFGTKPNPFQPGRNGAPMPTPAPSDVPGESAGAGQRDEAPTPASSLLSEVPGSRGGGARAGGPQVPVNGKSSGWADRLAAKVSTLLHRPAKPVRPAIPRFEKPPVQGELSLDSVTVLRNDLSDSDVELVARPRRKPAPAEGGEAEGRAPLEAVLAGKAAAETTFSRVSTRLFGMGKTTS